MNSWDSSFPPGSVRAEAPGEEDADKTSEFVPYVLNGHSPVDFTDFRNSSENAEDKIFFLFHPLPLYHASLVLHPSILIKIWSSLYWRPCRPWIYCITMISNSNQVWKKYSKTIFSELVEIYHPGPATHLHIALKVKRLQTIFFSTTCMSSKSISRHRLTWKS